MPKLASRKRETFAIEVAAMTPLASAYVAAGYRDTPWARYNASKLAHEPEVARRIDELQAEFADRSGIRAEYIQRQLLPLVEANSKDLFLPVCDDAGKITGDKLKSISELPRSLAAAISKIRCDPETGAVVEITLAGKTEAGNVLLRSIGGIIERHEHDISGIGARLNAALARIGPTESRQIAGPLIEGRVEPVAGARSHSVSGHATDESLPECM
jgi:Terminase small subunit